MNTTSKKCAATNARGSSCQAYAPSGSRFCFWHDPDRAAARKAARSKGGRARHGRQIDTTPAEPVTIESMADVIQLLQQAVNDVLGLENSISRARCVGYLATALVKALEVGELETRVAALERVLKQ